MKTAVLKFSEINRAKFNPRIELKPSDDEYQAIKKSLNDFGLVQPLIVNTRSNTLLSGHQRMRVMQDQGKESAECVLVNLSEIEAKRLTVVMNRVTGRWSAPDLTALLRELQAEQIDLASLGFHNPTELNALLSGTPKVTKRDPDDAPRAPDDSRALTRTGDLYDLHTERCHHRVMCGSSTDPKHMEKLCGDRLAQLVFTDPPYGISYRGNVADAIRGVKPQSKSDLIKNDTMSGEVMTEFLATALKYTYDHTAEDSAIYCFFAGSRYSETEAAFTSAGWRIKQHLNWIKSMVIGRSDYHFAHEPILYGAKLGQNSQWFGDRCETTIFETTAEDLAKLTKEQAIALLQSLKQQTTAWEEKKDPPSIIQHPNQKPVSLAGRAMRNSSLPGHHVLDSFAGSGSTCIAAELHDRNALTIDLSRGHIDVVIRRFAETFENVTIRRNGKAFDPAKVHAEK